MHCHSSPTHTPLIMFWPAQDFRCCWGPVGTSLTTAVHDCPVYPSIRSERSFWSKVQQRSTILPACSVAVEVWASASKASQSAQKDIAHRCSFPGHNWNKPNERTKPRAFNEWRHLQICRAATHAGLDEALNLALTTWVTPSYIDHCNMLRHGIYDKRDDMAKLSTKISKVFQWKKLDPRKSVVCWPCDCDVSTPVGITMLEGTKRGTLGSTWRMLETWCERGNMRHNDRNYPQILAKKLSVHQTVGFGYPPATPGFPNIHESWHMTRLQRWMLINY